jgi:hypothetical protein
MTKEERQGCLLISAFFAVTLAVIVLCFCAYGVALAIQKNQPKRAQTENKK